MKKILYGVSGIGNGHSNRQIPLIDELAKENKIVILAYQDSLKALSNQFRDNKNIKLIEIDVPFIVGTKDGLDFGKTADNSYNQNKDFLKINSQALDNVEKLIGIPDLVISDYEPVCAQYAYAKGAPLVTIDQQSKYLYSDLPKEINGFTFADEIQRLHMFFPTASARIACSFFRTKAKMEADSVIFMPPPIKPAVVSMKRKPDNNNQILVYISAAREFVQSPKEIIETLSQYESAKFNLFVSGKEIEKYNALVKNKGKNITLFQTGDPMFMTLMQTCDGIITTAGHSLLSEAMYLGIPVYAIPVEPYEQHMNAKAIGDNKFGISHTRLDKIKISEFVESLKEYTDNIRNDKEILIRGNGKDLIVHYLKKNFLSKKKILIFSPPFNGHLNILKELIKDTKDKYSFCVAITGWTNIQPDIEGINPDIVKNLSRTDLKETDPALWTFPRVVELLEDSLKLARDYKPDLIIYDFFSLEGLFTGKLLNIPYWCSIPALIGPFENSDYRDQKINSEENHKAIQYLQERFNLNIDTKAVEMISDGFHIPGQVNVVWSFENVTPSNFMQNRAQLPYVFIGNLRGDNKEKQTYKNKKPMIFISFGTVVMNNLWNQQEEIRDALRNFIKELANRWNNDNYQIIFVTQGKDILKSYPQNWWVYDYVDQVDILSRADLFITHGGSNSFHEAIMLNVPMILIPFFGDQLLVAKTAEKLLIGKQAGGAESIDTHSTKSFLNSRLADAIEKDVEEVLSDSKYTENYLNLQLKHFPILNLLQEEIPYENGDLIIGNKNYVPKSKEELPIDIESYIQLIQDKSDTYRSPEMTRVLNTLSNYIGKNKSIARKIMEYFSCVHNVHCFKDREDYERYINIVEELMDAEYGNISIYEAEQGIWTKIKGRQEINSLKKPKLPKKVILTSKNINKVEAVKNAFLSFGTEVKLECIDPELQIDEQLVGADNIAWGTMERLMTVKTSMKEKSTIISTVSGIINICGKWIDTAVVIIMDENGNTAIAKSTGLTFPSDLVHRTKQRGFNKHTIGSVLAEELADHNVSTNPHLYLTTGYASRVRFLEQAITETLNKLF